MHDADMGQDQQTPITRADRAVKTTEAWWSFFEQLWGARALMGPLLAVVGLVTTALYNVFSWVNQFGWAGWVLALVPSSLVVGGTFWALHGVFNQYHLRKLRKEREFGLPAVRTSASARQEPVDDRISVALSAHSQRLTNHVKTLVNSEMAKIPAYPGDAAIKEIVQANLPPRLQLDTEALATAPRRLDLIEEKLAIVVDMLIHREMACLAEETKRKISEFEKRYKQTSTGGPAGPMPASDFSKEDISKKISQITRDVKSDVKYLILNGDDEAERFGSGEKKREWIIQGKIIDYLKSVPMRFAKPDDFLSSIRNLK